MCIETGLSREKGVVTVTDSLDGVAEDSEISRLPGGRKGHRKMKEERGK